MVFGDLMLKTLYEAHLLTQCGNVVAEIPAGLLKFGFKACIQEQGESTVDLLQAIPAAI